MYSDVVLAEEGKQKKKQKGVGAAVREKKTRKERKQKRESREERKERNVFSSFFAPFSLPLYSS